MTDSFDPNAPALAGSGVFGLPHSPEQAGVVLIPVPWDATTSYLAGAAQGPEAIFAASRQVDLYDLETDPSEKHNLSADQPGISAVNAVTGDQGRRRNCHYA